MWPESTFVAYNKAMVYLNFHVLFYLYMYIVRPQIVVYPPHITCVSTYCSTYFFIGRPRFVVYPPRTIWCHVYLYASLLVDHDLWSTLDALHVTMFICTYVIW